MAQDNLMVEELVRDKMMVLGLAIEIIEMEGRASPLWVSTYRRNNEVNQSNNQDAICSRIRGSGWAGCLPTPQDAEEEVQLQDLDLLPILIRGIAVQ